MWWESASGVKFRQTLTAAVREEVQHEPNFQEALTFIFNKTRINPSVVDRWRQGGNPSIINIQKILEQCKCDSGTMIYIIESLRDYKQKERENGKVEAPKEPLKLKAIVNEYDPERKKYWVRTYNGNSFVHGDRITHYGYAKKFILTPHYRAKIAAKLGHNNFIIEFDGELSIPEMPQ